MTDLAGQDALKAELWKQHIEINRLRFALADAREEINHLTLDLHTERAAVVALRETIEQMTAGRDALREALGMWLALYDNAAGYEGKYGKALDAAIASQQIKIDAAAKAARAALEATNG